MLSEVARPKGSSVSSFSAEEAEKSSLDSPGREQESPDNGAFDSPLIVEQDFDDAGEFRRRGSGGTDRHATPTTLRHPVRLFCSSSSSNSMGPQQRLAVDPNDPYPHVKRSYLYTRGSTDSSNVTRTSSPSQDENTFVPPSSELCHNHGRVVPSEKRTPEKHRRLNSITNLSPTISQRVIMSAPRGYDDGCNCPFCYCGSSNRCLRSAGQQSQLESSGLSSFPEYRWSPGLSRGERDTNYRVIPLCLQPSMWPAAVNFSRGVPGVSSRTNARVSRHHGESGGDCGHSSNNLRGSNCTSSSCGDSRYSSFVGGAVPGVGVELGSQPPEGLVSVGHDPYRLASTVTTSPLLDMVFRHGEQPSAFPPASLPRGRTMSVIADGKPFLPSAVTRLPLLEKQLSFTAGGTAYYADFIDGHLLAVWYFGAGPGGGPGADSRGRYTALQYSLSNWKVYDCIKHKTEDRGINTCLSFHDDASNGEKREGGDETRRRQSSLQTNLGRLVGTGGGVTQGFSASHNTLLHHYRLHDRPRIETMCRSEELSSVFPPSGGCGAGGGRLGRTFPLSPSFPVQRSPGPPVFSMQNRGDVWTLLDWKCISLHPHGDLTVYNFCPSSISSSSSSSLSLVDKRDF